MAVWGDVNPGSPLGTDNADISVVAGRIDNLVKALDGTDSVNNIDIGGGFIDGTPVGNTTAAAGAFTSLVASTIKGDFASIFASTLITTGGSVTASAFMGAAATRPTDVNGFICPVGVILAYGGATAPTGWLICNGASISRGTYADLFTAIGTAYGTASGTTFNVPDLRGRFLRGVDSAVGRDPDRATRTAMNAGGATGDNVGSIQDEALKAHTHVIDASFVGGGANFDLVSNVGNGAQIATALTVETNVGAETRPINAYVVFIIKY